MTATLAAPAVEVQIDGRPVDADILSLRVSAVLNQPTQCEIVLLGKEIADLEDTLSVRVTDEVFTGEVTCVELVYSPDGQTSWRIRAYDRLHRLRRHEPLRVFENVTVADLATELAAHADLQVGATQTGPTLERVVQHGPNDLALLTETARRAGLHLAMDGDRLRLVTLDGYDEPVEVELGTSLLEATFEANLDRTVDEVTAYGWHTQSAEVYEERAGSGQQSGVLTDQPGRSGDELQARAQARLDESSAAATTISGVAIGNPALSPGRRVEVSGVAERFAATYTLTEVVHTVDATGYQTTFTSRPPAPQHATTASTLTLGRVTAVDDPLALGRVQVTLPALGDLDAGWYPVLAQAAGPGKEILTLPNVEDTVLVALPNGIPAHGIVLGALFGEIVPQDPGIIGGAVKRWTMRTPDGQTIVLDDDQHSMRLQNKVGSFVELGPDLTRLHANTDLVIQAPGRAVTIRADTVDFVRAESPDPTGAVA